MNLSTTGLILAADSAVDLHLHTIYSDGRWTLEPLFDYLLTHPGHGDGFVTCDVQLLDQFRQEAPIDGLEVYHPVHTPAQTAMYREYAQRHHLLTSTGSDSHGPDKPPIKYRAELNRDLLERVGIRIE